MNLTNSVYKEFSVNNPMSAPEISVTVDSENHRLNVTWEYSTSMETLAGLQYSMDGSDSWQDAAIDNTQSGSFTVDIPADTAGMHYITVRPVATDGEYGLSRRTDYAVESDYPIVEITGIERGILQGTISDDNLAEWTISVKETDSEADYVQIGQGSECILNGYIELLDLDNSSYTDNTWYTVKVCAVDRTGNESYNTFDWYKETGLAWAEKVTASHRIRKYRVN